MHKVTYLNTTSLTHSLSTNVNNRSYPTSQVLPSTYAATVEVLVGRAVLITLLLLVDPVCLTTVA
jgi:hypothetical protein